MTHTPPPPREEGEEGEGGDLHLGDKDIEEHGLIVDPQLLC